MWCVGVCGVHVVGKKYCGVIPTLFDYFFIPICFFVTCFCKKNWGGGGGGGVGRKVYLQRCVDVNRILELFSSDVVIFF